MAPARSNAQSPASSAFAMSASCGSAAMLAVWSSGRLLLGLCGGAMSFCS